MKLKQFQIDEKFLCSVTVKKEMTFVIEEGNPLLSYNESLKPGNNVVTSTSFEDHPEFTKLRNLLEEQGYILTQRGWWNGDIVLKSFSLNGYTFRKHDKFPCASAIKNTMGP
jgi:hypothetical protein